MTWANFLEEFNNKYYNVSILAAKVIEFSNLKQGNLPIIEYIRKFDRLARYAPDMVTTNTARVNRFLEGLKQELAKDVDMGRKGPISYREVVQRDIRAEQREMRIEQAKIQANPPLKGFQSNRQNQHPNGNNRRGNQSFQARQGPNKRFMSGQPDRRLWIECRKCGKKHPEECKARTTSCYKCGKEGHFIKDYPLLRNDQKKEEPKKTNARVFAITQADVDASTSVVSGEILIVGISTYALIDSGATYSFASMIYVKKLVDHQRCYQMRSVQLYDQGRYYTQTTG